MKYVVFRTMKNDLNSYSPIERVILRDNDYLVMVDKIVSTFQVFCGTESGIII